MGIMKGVPVSWKFSASIVAVNLIVILLGVAVVHMSAPGPAEFVFDVSWFTFLVGLHQYASDVFNWLKRQSQPAPQRA